MLGCQCVEPRAVLRANVAPRCAQAGDDPRLIAHAFRQFRQIFRLEDDAGHSGILPVPLDVRELSDPNRVFTYPNDDANVCCMSHVRFSSQRVKYRHVYDTRHRNIR